MTDFFNADVISLIFLLMLFVIVLCSYFKVLKERDNVEVYFKNKRKIDCKANGLLAFISSFFIFIEAHSRFFDLDFLKDDIWWWFFGGQILLCLSVSGLGYLFQKESANIIKNAKYEEENKNKESNLLNNSPTVEFTKSKSDNKNKVKQ